MKIIQLETSGLPVSARARCGRAPKERVGAGAFVAPRDLVTVSGNAVSVPDPEHYVHLHFRRFAGCPICHLHLRSIVQRHDEIVRAGIREIVLFYSTTEELKAHVSDLPFAVVADPQKRLYAEFGVTSSVRSLLDPRAWLAIIRSLSHSLWGIIFKRKPAPSLNFQESRLGLPADFLIASDGTVLASKHGVHSYDQWSVDELLGLVASKRGFPSRHRKE